LEDLSGEELDRLLGELSNKNKQDLKKTDNKDVDVLSSKSSVDNYGSEIEAALDD
jgi:hypothetical protein